MTKKYLETILKLNRITKFYGRIRALNEVGFVVPRGAIFGVLGPNGSGKTTLLGIVMGVLRSNSGDFNWFDLPPTHLQRQQIGCLLETPNFYHYLSGKRNLEIVAQIRQRGHADIDAVLDLVRLTERKDSKFNTYSLGMKQRLAIASCLLGNPSVLVFDEPTNGLDPAGIAEIRSLIRRLAEEGKTIILASHLLDEVEKVCTHVAILQRGNLLTAGRVSEKLVNEEFVEAGSEDLTQLSQIMSAFPGLKETKKMDGHLEFHFQDDTPRLSEINLFCYQKGIILNHLLLRKRSLESKFIELTKSESN